MRCGIIFLFRFGGLAQLVRAPASHAGGLGFESLILHHTVRTRTRFFTKKGSGTFFVYRRFAFATATNTPVGCLSNRTVCVSRWRGFAPTSSAEGLHRALNEQRQGITMIVVSCLLLCIPLYCAFRVNRCVCPSVRTREKGRVLTYSSGLLPSCMVYSNQ